MRKLSEFFDQNLTLEKGKNSMKMYSFKFGSSDFLLLNKEDENNYDFENHSDSEGIKKFNKNFFLSNRKGKTCKKIKKIKNVYKSIEEDKNILNHNTKNVNISNNIKKNQIEKYKEDENAQIKYLCSKNANEIKTSYFSNSQTIIEEINTNNKFNNSISKNNINLNKSENNNFTKKSDKKQNQIIDMKKNKNKKINNYININIPNLNESENGITNKMPSKSKSGDFEIDNVPFDFVEASYNFQGNYQNYISRVISSLSPLYNVNYQKHIQEKLVLLPEYDKKKTLILDMDETLIHSDFDCRFKNHDKTITFNFKGSNISVDIFLRPGVFEFLKTVSEIFEIFIFTASKKEYADAVLDYLDPDHKIIKHRLYRESCIPINNKVYIKDLRIFVNIKPENIILVDNSLYSFCNQPKNGVLINSFYHDKQDRELINLLNYLQNYLYDVPDVRLVNEQIFNFENLISQYKNVPCLNDYTDEYEDEIFNCDGNNDISENLDKETYYFDD